MRKLKPLRYEPPRKTITVRQLAHRIGCSAGRIRNAARRLGLHLQPRRPGAARPLVVSPDESAAVCELLSQTPRNKPLHKTVAGEWGTGGKPKRCKGCKRSSVPHVARGKCSACLRREKDGRSLGNVLPKRPWSATEDKHLKALWGTAGIAAIAKKLGRTVASIQNRKTALRLGPAVAGKKSVAALVKESGYERSRIETMAKRLGIKFERMFRCSARDPILRPGRSPASSRKLLVTEEQCEMILEELAKFPDGKRLYRNKPGLRRTDQGVWGVGSKPSKCRGHGKADRPHVARGYCGACYQMFVMRGKKAA